MPCVTRAGSAVIRLVRPALRVPNLSPEPKPQSIVMLVGGSGMIKNPYFSIYFDKLIVNNACNQFQSLAYEYIVRW